MAKKKSTRRRRRSSVRGLSSGDAGKVITQTVLPGAIGAIAARMLVDKVLPAEYAAQSNYAILGAGILAALMAPNSMIQAAGAGAAIVATSRVVQDLVDGQEATATGLGLLRPGVPAVRISNLNRTDYTANAGVTTM